MDVHPYLLDGFMWFVCGSRESNHFSIPKIPQFGEPRDQDVPAEPLRHLSQGSNNASTASYSDGTYYLLDLMDLMDLLDIPCYTYQLM